MKNLLSLLFAVSICLHTFAVQEHSILQDVLLQGNNFLGGRTDESSEVFSIHRIGRSCSDLPSHFSILQMQERKNKSKAGNKVTGTGKGKATPQPTIITSIDQLNNERIFNLIDSFFDSAGASGPVEATSFLLQQFFETDKQPIHLWDGRFLSDTVFRVTELNTMLMQLYEACEQKREFAELAKKKGGARGRS